MKQFEVIIPPYGKSYVVKAEYFEISDGGELVFYNEQDSKLLGITIAAFRQWDYVLSYEPNESYTE